MYSQFQELVTIGCEYNYKLGTDSLVGVHLVFQAGDTEFILRPAPLGFFKHSAD